MVRAFYIAYDCLVTQGKKKKVNAFILVKFVIVREKDVGCISNIINVLLDRDIGFEHEYEVLPIVLTLDDIKGCLSP